MKKILLSNVRSHARRYIATGIAIAISTAFMLAAFAFGRGLNDKITASITQQFSGAASVITPTSDSDISSTISRVEQVEGVASAVPQGVSYVRLHASGRRTASPLLTLNPSPLYQPQLDSGRFAHNEKEIVISTGDAAALKVKIGDTIEVEDWGSQARIPLTLVGLSSTGQFFGSNNAYVTHEGLKTIVNDAFPQHIFVVAEGNSEPTQSQQDELTARINAALGNDSAQTAYATSDKQVKQTGINSTMSTAMFLIFPVIAVIVALIVVATTFKVIVQQRRREVALLRCIGATGKQIRRLVRYETLLVGLCSAIIGTVLGAFLSSFGLSISGLTDSFTEGFSVLGPVVLVGAVILGTLLTLIAGLSPSRGVTRIPPLAALNSSNAPTETIRKSRLLSTIVGLLLAAVGIVAIWKGIAQVHADPNSVDETGFLIAFLGIVATFIASILLASVTLPALTRLVGVCARGTIARLAARNSVRNPDRTSATGTSVVIGTALVVTMLAGASSLQETLNKELDDKRPFDLTITSTRPISRASFERIKGISGVSEAVSVPSAYGSFTTSSGEEEDATLMSDANLANVAHSPVESATDTTVLVGPHTVQQMQGSKESGYTAQICGPSACQTFQAKVVSWAQGAIWLNQASFEKLAGDTSTIGSVWVKLDEQSDAGVTITDIQALDSSFSADGPAQERQMYQRTINAILLVVTALLAVSVLVALVGLANTLSLSVVERTRENGLLRAMGLTRKQMMRMLSIEALLVGVTAAVLGTILGVTFGWLGLASLPLDVDELKYVVPWLHIGAVLAIAVIAALLASILPGRRAARVSPVEALVHE